MGVDPKGTPREVPLVVKTVGATARKRRFGGLLAIATTMSILSTLETS
jgi:hypothetical protein